MTADNNTTYEQVYNVAEDDNLISRVGLVVCLLVQRGLFVAGFGISKELLTIHYMGYNTNKPVWDLDFFEHMLLQEPLLAVKEKVKGVFLCSDKNLIVPEALYDETEAKNWLKHIHFIEAKDEIMSFHLEEDKAKYLLAAPLKIMELIRINFRRAVINPLAIYNFKNNRPQSLILQCCLTGEQANITLHNYSQLLWHKIVDYATAEDVTYEIKHFCMENNISPTKISFRCNAISAGEYETITQLTTYFAGIRTGNNRPLAGNWDAAISLAQQLLTCAL